MNVHKKEEAFKVKKEIVCFDQFHFFVASL